MDLNEEHKNQLKKFEDDIKKISNKKKGEEYDHNIITACLGGTAEIAGHGAAMALIDKYKLHRLGFHKKPDSLEKKEHKKINKKKVKKVKKLKKKKVEKEAEKEEDDDIIEEIEIDEPENKQPKEKLEEKKMNKMYKEIEKALFNWSMFRTESLNDVEELLEQYQKILELKFLLLKFWKQFLILKKSKYYKI